MLFHFLNFSQCVVCMFGHKTIYKVTNLSYKSTPKGDISFFKKSLFKNYNERLVWTTKLFSCIWVEVCLYIVHFVHLIVFSTLLNWLF